MPATGLFDKGAVVEEPVDTWFFRPLGLRVARALAPTRVTADHVTGLALFTGLIAAGLFLPDSVALSALGVLMFIISDIFDSADGQLARMRGTSTRLGRVLDGISDTLRFGTLYFVLMFRMLAAGSTWWVMVPLGLLAGISHGLQSGMADYIKQLYLSISSGDGELDLPEDLIAEPSEDWLSRFARRQYFRYLLRQTRLLPRSAALIRWRRRHDIPGIAGSWAATQRSVVRRCAWIGQNIRFLLLALLVVPGHAGWFIAFTLGPLNLVAAALRYSHERRAARLMPQPAERLAVAA